MLEVLMDKVQVRVRIEGLVQGVNYRYFTRQKAQELGVNGWVRNLADGSVECLMEGERDKVPPGARVKKVTTLWEEYRGDVQEFSITY